MPENGHILSNNAETTEWLNQWFQDFLFDKTKGDFFKALHNRILERLKRKLSNMQFEYSTVMERITLGDFGYGNTLLSIYSVQTQRLNDGSIIMIVFFAFNSGLNVSISVDFGMGLKKLGGSIKLVKYKGKMALKLSPNANISLTISDIPKFNIALNMGTKSLEKFSKLVTLALKSVFYNNIVYRNYQSFYLSTLCSRWDLLLVRIDRKLSFDTLFVRVCNGIFEHSYDSVGLFCDVEIGQTSQKTTIASNLTEPVWNSVMIFDVSYIDIKEADIIFVVYSKGKRLGRTKRIARFMCRFDQIREGQVFSTRLEARCERKAKLIVDILYRKRDFIEDWKFGDDFQSRLQSSLAERYFSKVDWSNIKLAIESMQESEEPIPHIPSDIDISCDTMDVHEVPSSNSDSMIPTTLKDYRTHVLKLIAKIENLENMKIVKGILEAFRCELEKMIILNTSENANSAKVDPLVQSFISIVLKQMETVTCGSGDFKELQDAFHLFSSKSENGSLHSVSSSDLKPRLLQSYSATDLSLSAGLTFMCHFGVFPCAMMLTKDSICLEISFVSAFIESSFENSLCDGIFVGINSEESKKYEASIQKDNRIVVFPFGGSIFFPLHSFSTFQIRQVSFKKTMDSFYYASCSQSTVEISFEFDNNEIVGYVTDERTANLWLNMLQAEFLIGNKIDIDYRRIQTLEIAKEVLPMTDSKAQIVIQADDLYVVGRFIPPDGVFMAYAEIRIRTEPIEDISKFAIDKNKILLLQQKKNQLLSPHNVEPFALREFGIKTEVEPLSFSCSFFRRGLIMGCLYLYDRYCCFLGKKHIVRPFRAVIPTNSINQIQTASRWFSHGIQISFDRGSDELFVFGFKQNTLNVCFSRLKEICNNVIHNY